MRTSLVPLKRRHRESKSEANLFKISNRNTSVQILEHSEPIARTLLEGNPYRRQVGNRRLSLTAYISLLDLEIRATPSSSAAQRRTRWRSTKFSQEDDITAGGDLVDSSLSLHRGHRQRAVGTLLVCAIRTDSPVLALIAHWSGCREKSANSGKTRLRATADRPSAHRIQGWLTIHGFIEATTTFSALLKRTSQPRKPALSSKRTHSDTGIPSSPMSQGSLVPRNCVWS
jgi:hypothetical protein